MKRWKKEKGRLGQKWVATSEWSTYAMGDVDLREVTELELNWARGFRGSDLDFLLGFPSLLRLTLRSPWVKNDDVIHELLSLRYLNLSTPSKSEIRFSVWPNLQEVAMEPWRARASSIYECKSLRRLSLEKWNGGQDIMSFATLENLEVLCLYSPTRLESLRGIENLSNLTELRLILATRLTSLEGIESLSRLVRLRVDTCRKVSDISPLSSLSSLKELEINNCGDIQSLQPISVLKWIENLVFVESTNIVDGDMKPILDLPHLNSVSFVNRKHYSHRNEDFENLRG